jgi:D-glycero-D-manno-heptose 1,7-bisphosphate phosphatase
LIPGAFSFDGSIVFVQYTGMNISAVFLDREGVITPKLEKGEYLLSQDDVRLADGVVNGLRQLNELGIPIFIVSNQSCVQRGMITMENALAIHQKVLRLLSERGVAIRDSRICPHVDSDGCDCRKPKPGMILDLCSEYGIDPERTVMVGDSVTDIEAGERSNGIMQLYIGSPTSDVSEVRCVPILDAAVEKMLSSIS